MRVGPASQTWDRHEGTKARKTQPRFLRVFVFSCHVGFTRWPLATIVALALAIGATLSAQSPDIEAQRKLIREVADSLKAKADTAKPAPMPKNWKAGRTPWGDPDIAGVYTNSGMVSMSLNTFGVPLEPTGERFPAVR